MAPTAKSPKHLILKLWQTRQRELKGYSRLRIPVAFQQMLDEARGTRCVIYIPHRAWPKQKTLEGHYIASGILHGSRKDPVDSSMLIVDIDGAEEFLRPVPLRFGDRYLATRDKHGFQDKSLEQRDIVEIEPSMFQIILGFGTKASVFLPLERDDEEAVDLNATPNSTAQGAGEGTPIEQRIRQTLERLAAPRRSTYVRRLTRMVDGGRCVTCGFEAKIGRRFAAIEVIHFHARSVGGPDTLSNTAVMCSRCHKLYDALCFTLTDDFAVTWSGHFRQFGNQQALGDRAVFQRPSALLPYPQNLRWHQIRFAKNEASLDQQS